MGAPAARIGGSRNQRRREAMQATDITVSDLETMGAAVNYRRWMFRRIERFLGRRILEVGAGIGNFTELLLDRELVVATDIHQDCVAYLSRRFTGRTGVIALQMNAADPALVQLARYNLDTIVCMNVLEHIEDDTAALAHMHAVLQPSGRLVLLVPAFQFLFGTVDESLNHYRRYTKRTLLPKVRAAGFHVERAFYMNVVGMAGWFVNNRLVKRSEESPQQIQFFDRVVAPMAEWIERVLPPPVGLSLIAACRRGNEGRHAGGYP
jgi:2-polyprenyl-3-methyl-5-hydroxy-6-metoxy-1,4-benzoquinol methylase